MSQIDRRVPFFVVASLVCVALVPVAEPGLRYVPVATAIVYAVLAVLFFFDWRGRQPPA